MIDSLRSLHLEENTEEKLVKKETIEIGENFLKSFGLNPTKIEVRTFLSIYVLKEDGVLSDNNENERKLKYVVNKIVNIIEELDSQCFLKYYNKYIILFEKWKTQDRDKLVYFLNQTYKSIEELKNSSSGEIKDQLEEVLSDLRSEVRILGGKIDMENCSPREMTNLRDVNDIMEIAYMAFWDSFSSELAEKEYDRVPILLDEIQGRLKKLVPNRPDIHRELDENIDIELISQMIVNDVFTPIDFYKLSRYILGKIREFEAPVDNAITDELLEELNQTFKDGFTISDYLPKLFSEIYVKLENIEKITNILEV